MSSQIDSSDEQFSASEQAHSSSPSPLQFSRASSYRGREYTLYDAVAGQVSLNERVQPHGGSSRRSNRPGSGNLTSRTYRLAPEEVLFRRHNAPTRYAEHDIYWAHEDLLPSQQLPDSALLRSVHCYASKFYDYTALDSSHLHSKLPKDGSPSLPSQTQPHSEFFQKKANTDLRSLDETAILAFGILLEEASREVLGKRGDLVFTEAEGYQPPQAPSQAAGATPATTAATLVPSSTGGTEEGKANGGGALDTDVSHGEGGPKKRRKVASRRKKRPDDGPDRLD
ncbi:hypothetical protein QC764_200140 [Podospora pseudoanserina]|uniref:Rrn9 domain-containing protein n=1 Tax=Podospora pseudoanserina TaxID=2609844 RepID=A0ABR0IEZ1_9PEZI|nr:hypothetical protein QC764_200140 [Podospora pseudoanserina]